MDGLCIVGHKKLQLEEQSGDRGYGGGSLWRQRLALGRSTNEEEDFIMY
jgi:hypothetical protein